jgi:3-oxoacyl-(acyl-carrier-protein) synthase
MKRVVVTGMGMVSPLGRRNKTWEKMLMNDSGISKIKEIPDG